MIRGSTLQALRKQKEHQALLATFAGDKWQDNDLIFSSSVGTVLNPSNVRKELKRILLLANLPHIRFHDLRHTSASHMLNRGVSVIVVSNILGHSKPSITLDIYGHSITSMQDKAAHIMDDLVTISQIEVKTSSEESVINTPPDTRNI